MKKLYIFAIAFIPATVAVYWWNLDNKFLFYVVRPFLNKHYDAQNRDIKL